MNEQFRYELAYHSFVWLVSALAGTSRAVSDGRFQSYSQLLAVAGVSGFLGFAVVGLFAPSFSDPDFNGLFYLGVASLVGLAGKEQTTLISLAWRGILERLFPGSTEKEEDAREA